MLGPVRVLIGTTNAGKWREFQALFGDFHLQWHGVAEIGAAPILSEDGATYVENAAHKALVLARWSRMVTLADDSGLEVDALGGAPGIRSARYAGPEHDSAANIAKLLHALCDVPAERRAARFRCAVVVARPDGTTLTAAGACAGRIANRPRGTAGFGYDPIFLYEPEGLTFAEMSEAAKHAVSHRARACRELRRRLPAFLGAGEPPAA